MKSRARIFVFACFLLAARAWAADLSVREMSNAFSLVKYSDQQIAEWIDRHPMNAEEKKSFLQAYQMTAGFIFTDENGKRIPQNFQTKHLVLEKFLDEPAAYEELVRAIQSFESRASTFTPEKPPTTPEEWEKAGEEAHRNAAQGVAGDTEILRAIEAKAPLRGQEGLYDRLRDIYGQFPRLAPVNHRELTQEVGMVPVNSVFSDGKRKRRETGTGWVVERDGKKFLLTDAHLLAGEDKQLGIGRVATPLADKELLFDNDNDLAMVELKDQSLPAALIFNEKTKKLETSDAFQAAVNAGNLRTRSGEYKNPAYQHRTFIAPWAKPLAAINQAPVRAELNRTVLPQISEKQVHVFDKTSPGMSGTLLIGNQPGKDGEVLGLLAQYNNFFDDSYYTSAHFAVDLFDKYKEGKRGSLSDTHWQMRNGLTYRSFGKDNAETNFVNKPAGNGELVDSGDGTYAEPGDGTYAEPGDGTYAEPGDGTYAEPGDGTYAEPGVSCASKVAELNRLQKDSASLVSALLKTPELAPNEIYYRYGIRPGLIWQGKPVLGFLLRERGKPPFSVYANPQALDFLRAHKGEYEIEAIGPGGNLTDLLRLKAGYAYADADTPSIGKKSFHLNTRDNSAMGIMADIDVSPTGVKLKLKGDYLEDKKGYEEVSLDLDQQGRLRGNPFFTPIVEVKGKTGQRYLVDLRSLFFTDLGNVGAPIVASGGGPKNPAEAVEVEKKSLHLSLRSDRSQDESRFILVPSDCPELTLEQAREGHWLDMGSYSRPRCNK